MPIRRERLARRVWGRAFAALDPPRWDGAENQLKESLRLFESGQQRIEAAYTQVAWGKICHYQGNNAEAREHWKQAVNQLELTTCKYQGPQNVPVCENKHEAQNFPGIAVFVA